MTGMAAVHPRCPGAKSAARLEAAADRNPPVQATAWSIPTHDRPEGGGGRANQRGADQEEVRQASTEGTWDAPREVRCPMAKLIVECVPCMLFGRLGWTSTCMV